MGKHQKDFTGYVNDYGIEAIRCVGRNEIHKAYIWECKCPHCGRLFNVEGRFIKNVKSCGCLSTAEEKILKMKKAREEAIKNGTLHKKERITKKQKIYEKNMSDVAKTLAHFFE